MFIADRMAPESNLHPEVVSANSLFWVSMGREDMITPELVKARLSYNHETGILTWKARDESEFLFNKQWNGKFAGKSAGTINKNGYVSIVMMLNGKNYSIYGHHAAWILYYGSPCEKHIDHINGNTGDNKICSDRDWETS